MNGNNSRVDLDCAVCLQKCNHPTQLPCGHIFCFLCVKGIAYQSKKCAMCRAEIPPNYLDNPILLGPLSAEQVNNSLAEEVYQWFYEGRNGDPDCTLLLAGTLYNIDFQTMTQVRRSDQTRRRRVRRDTPSFPSKGIAGIKTEDGGARQVKSDDEETADVVHIPTVQEVIEISDDETSDLIPPALILNEDLNGVIDRISSVSLTDNISHNHNNDETR
ncbi:hypothetical protein HF086_002221 [Spodoptera exigua]|uniref:E3 ubiquitin-protein ligase n=1 Tax=Spodoptera exigua TaxID=7107 RepID=A0A922SDK1_SPOEX|nr:hypothetical protein HF086_002221 [Spodoptera exigua]